jgi:hypothetical protein
VEKKKKNNCVKSKGRVVNLILGEDIEMNKVVDMENKAIIGRVRGRRFELKTLTEWATESWANRLGYTSNMLSLERGWFAFNMRSLEDAQ